MDKLFHPTLYNGCDDLSMLGLKLIHVSERGPMKQFEKLLCDYNPNLEIKALVLCGYQ